MMHHDRDLTAAIHECAHATIARALRWEVGGIDLQKCSIAPPEDAPDAEPGSFGLILLAGDDATGTPKLEKTQLIRMINALRAGPAHRLPPGVYSRDNIMAMAAVAKMHGLHAAPGTLIDSFRALRREAKYLVRQYADEIEASAVELRRVEVKKRRWAAY